MFHLAKALGIEGNKYLTNMNKSNNQDILIENDKIVNFFAKNGITLKCPFCQSEKNVNKITESYTTFKSLMSCQVCDVMTTDLSYLFNVVIKSIKYNLFNYYKGARTCMKCNFQTRLFTKFK